MFHSIQDAKDAMDELDHAFREVEILLDTSNGPDHSRPPPNRRAYEMSSNFRTCAFTERGSVISDLEDITKNLRNE